MGHLHNGIVLNLKKKKILPPGTVWMDLENIMLSEIKPVRERQISYDFTHMWNLMNKCTNKENGDRLIDGEQGDSWGGRLGGGGTEQKGRRTHGHGHQCGDSCGEGDIRGLNGNGKKYNRD